MPDKKLTELPENTSANNNDKIYIASAGGVSKFIRLSTLVDFIISLLPPPSTGGDSVRVFLGRIAPADIPTTGELGEYFINSSTLTYWQWTPDDSEVPEGPGTFQDTGDPVQDVEADTEPTLGSVNYVLSDGIYQALLNKANTLHSHTTSESWLSDIINLLVTKSGFVDQLLAKTEQGTGIVISETLDGKLRIDRSGGDGESGDWGSIGGDIEEQTDLKNTYSKIPVWTPVEPVAGEVTLPAVNGTNDYYEWTESGPDTLAHSGIFKDAGYKWGRVTLGSSSYTITLGAGYINPDGSAKTSIVLEGSPGQVREFQLVRKGSNWIVYQSQEAAEEGTTDYEVLTNKPSINGVELTGDVSLEDIGVTDAIDSAVDAAVVGLYDDRGNHDASTNLFPSSGGSGTAGAILKGDIWTISVAGTLGGTAVIAGQTVRAKVDSPGTTAGNWAISVGSTEIPDATETTKGKLEIATTAEQLAGTDDTRASTPLKVQQKIDASLGTEYVAWKLYMTSNYI